MAGPGKKGVAGGIFEEMMQKFKMMMQEDDPGAMRGQLLE